MEEIWKDVEGYEGLYKVSNIGKLLRISDGFIGKYGTNNVTYIFVGDFVTNDLGTYEVCIFKGAFCFGKKRITEINSKNLSITGNIHTRYV